MKLRPVISSLDEVPENVRDLYTARGDGKFVLDLDGTPPGFVEKNKLDEFRNNNTELLKQLDDLKKSYDGIDPAIARASIEEAQKLKDKQLIDAGKIDELVEQRISRMRGDFEGKSKAQQDALTKAQLERDQLNTRLASVLIDSSITKVLPNVGQVRRGAMADVIARAQSTWKVIDGNLVAVDAEGRPMYGSDGKSPLTTEEWATGLLESAGHLFEPSSGGGGKGGDPNSGSLSGKVVQRGDNRAFMANLNDIASGKVTVAP